MPFKLTLSFLILCNYSFAQIEGFRSPTQFDKFIKLEKIHWAAYANDVISFDKYNVSEALYKRFQKGEIKISEPLTRDNLIAGNKIVFLNKKELELRSFAPGSDLNSKPTNRVDSNSSSVMNVEQILYVANGKLYSYVPWVSPLISIYTSRDLFLGTSEYFSSCINPKYNFKSSKRDDLVFIKTTKRKFLIDTFPRTDMLKQLYGINMLEAIWKDIINDKNEFTNLRNNEKVSLEELKSYAYSNTNTIPLYDSLARIIGYGTISVPIYDSLGRVTGYQTFSEPISPSLFPQIEITQNWYYNYTKNIILNNITDITLYTGNKGFSDNGELKPVLKITLK